MTGSPADPAKPKARGAPLPLDARLWGPMRRFIEGLRAMEQRAFAAQRKVLSSTLAELKDLLALEGSTDESLLRLMDDIESAAKRGQLNQVETLVKSSVKQIRTRHQQMNQRLSHMTSQINNLEANLKKTQVEASYDALTRLFNRGVFDLAVTRIRDAAMPNHTAALLFVDLDHFKRVNDTYGHPAGDAVLKAVANTLVRTFPRKNDLVARYGGEEFVVLLQGVNLASAGILAARLLKNIRALEVKYEGETLRSTCSIGFAELQRRESTEAWIARADAALYRAKAEGRDRALAG